MLQSLLHPQCHPPPQKTCFITFTKQTNININYGLGCSSISSTMISRCCWFIRPTKIGIPKQPTATTNQQEPAITRSPTAGDILCSSRPASQVRHCRVCVRRGGNSLEILASGKRRMQLQLGGSYRFMSSIE